MVSLLKCPARYLLPVVLVCAALAIFLDFRTIAPDGKVTALRTVEPVDHDDEEGSVAAICGFAPCGMPILCE